MVTRAEVWEKVNEKRVFLMIISQIKYART